jgi:type II secretory pathway predicted ATPase ExeA/cell division septation protein DedD
MAPATQNSRSISWALPTQTQATEPDRCERIYTDFFNLRSAPFSITPDPEFLFLSETHRSVIEKIQYGIQSRMGFMLLTGEVGTGKTTLCRALLDHLQGRIRTVYVINPSLSGQELLAGILDDLGIAYPAQATKKELIDRLNRFLLAKENTRAVVIIVDDAQTMPLDTLEDLRLLSNLETDKNKLLQMLLVGQPELLTGLDQPQLRQLKQRVAVSCHLHYLTCDEVGGYIERRLFIAGNQGQVRFAPKVVRRIHKQSGGIPRMINKICDMALTAAYAANSYVVESHHLKAADSELIEMQGMGRDNGSAHIRRKLRPLTLLAAGATLLTALGMGFCAHAYLEQRDHRPGNPTAGTVPVSIPAGQVMAEPASISPSIPETRAYILQLGSYNTLATTLRALDIYAQKGMEVHWNGVRLGEKGLWYRVFAGRFASIEAARQYQNRMGLANVQILFAPWAVVIGPAGPADRIAALQNRLQSLGVDSYVAPGQGNLLHLCAGAFISQGRAEVMADQIHRQTGVATRAADFHPRLLSNRTGAAPGAGS